MSTGIFTLSIDFELIWGTLDKPKWRHFQKHCLLEREVIAGRLLDLFAEYEISASWCTVGHLFLDRCNPEQPRHPELANAAGPRGAARMRRDPGTSERIDPIFYGRSLVEQIMNCRVKQEIGSHTFTHLICDEAEATREVMEAELRACVDAAAQMGLKLESFVFPRNRVGHLDLLAQYGFTSYRGPDVTWYERAERRGMIHRMGHVWDILWAVKPPAVVPEWKEEGIWEIPGSMLYTPSFGLRRMVPVGLRVRRAKKGLEAAANSGRIFHLWFHPTDLAVRHEAMLKGLRQVLEYASRLRSEGKIEIRNMGEIAAQLKSRPAQTAAIGVSKS